MCKQTGCVSCYQAVSHYYQTNRIYLIICINNVITHNGPRCWILYCSALKQSTRSKQSQIQTILFGLVEPQHLLDSYGSTCVMWRCCVSWRCYHLSRKLLSTDTLFPDFVLMPRKAALWLHDRPQVISVL